MSLRCPPERLRVGRVSSSGREPELEQGGAGPARGARAAGSLEALERLLLAGEHPRHPIEVGDHLRRSRAASRARSAPDRARRDRGVRRAPSRAASGRHRQGAGRGRRRATPRRRDTSPPSGASSPARIFSRVDLPPPFGPTTPIRASGSIARSAPSRMRREPNDFVIAAPGEERHDPSGRAPAGTPDGGCRELVDAGKLPCHAGNLPLSLKGARPGPIDTR